jgi:hypothetical protein
MRALFDCYMGRCSCLHIQWKTCISLKVVTNQTLHLCLPKSSTLRSQLVCQPRAFVTLAHLLLLIDRIVTAASKILVLLLYTLTIVTNRCGVFLYRGMYFKKIRAFGQTGHDKCCVSSSRLTVHRPSKLACGLCVNRRGSRAKQKRSRTPRVSTTIKSSLCPCAYLDTT